MAALTLKKAQRKRVKLKIALSAPAGGGKPASSLILAYGLLKGEHPDWTDEMIWDKIAIIDTENGSGELYANTKIGGTWIGEYGAVPIAPPYEPQKYIDAIQLCKDSGIEVCICDSLSHAWSGRGGLLEKQGNISKRSGNSYTAWREVTPLHNALVDSILQTDMHMICTMRSKTEYVQEKDSNGKTTVRKVGLSPVQREGMEYEFSIFLEVDAEHQAYVSKDRTGTIADQYFMVDPSIGMKLAKWLEGSVPQNAADKVVAQAETKPVQDSGEDDLAALIVKIDALAKSLPDKGITKSSIVTAIKAITGGTANYNNIDDATVAQEVYSALKNMGETKC